MWISVGITVWILCGIKAFCWEKRCSSCLSLQIVALILGPIGLMLVGSTSDGTPMFVGRSNSIYWDDKEGQIKTKSGKCVYNRREVGGKFTKIFQRIETLSQKIRKLEQSKETKIENIRKDWLEWQQKCNKVIEENMEVEKRLEAQLQCGAKGHDKWEYVKKDLVFFRNSPELTGFFFKCSDCGLVITKTAKELTIVENAALKKLKLL